MPESPGVRFLPVLRSGKRSPRFRLNRPIAPASTFEMLGQSQEVPEPERQISIDSDLQLSVSRPVAVAPDLVLTILRPTVLQVDLRAVVSGLQSTAIDTSLAVYGVTQVVGDLVCRVQQGMVPFVADILVDVRLPESRFSDLHLVIGARRRWALDSQQFVTGRLVLEADTTCEIGTFRTIRIDTHQTVYRVVLHEEHEIQT
ncbi:hypothetical protein SCOR_15045 [Sulfidibacter corallicola]|uniref:Uncharacterized protein n=1 Tax=Sulfidibacter corallicola TaxID=2818388 RepID=A0A8A4U638_SULCO|nr:hypothetical protein [Sulfidibacter corallicola]QTD54215.1 hypothetical protein J3U87_17355 [Sulfidibacter corallicola]